WKSHRLAARIGPAERNVLSVVRPLEFLDAAIVQQCSALSGRHIKTKLKPVCIVKYANDFVCTRFTKQLNSGPITFVIGGTQRLVGKVNTEELPIFNFVVNLSLISVARDVSLSKI